MYCIPIGCWARRPKLDASGAEDVGAAFSMRAQVRYTSKSRRRMPRRIIERYGSLAISDGIVGRRVWIAYIKLVIGAHKGVMEKMSINLLSALAAALKRDPA